MYRIYSLLALAAALLAGLAAPAQESMKDPPTLMQKLLSSRSNV